MQRRHEPTFSRNLESACSSFSRIADILERDEEEFRGEIEEPDVDDKSEFAVGRRVVAISDHAGGFFDSVWAS
jgi:hypothetical protein